MVEASIRGGEGYFSGFLTRKILNRIGLTIVLIHVGLSSFCQSIIKNGDFENYWKCPSSYSYHRKDISRLLNNWFSPTKGTPDYFNRCSRGSASIPLNHMGNCESNSGDGYAGIILFSPQVYYRNKSFYREYLTTRFIEPLEPEVYYELSFSIALAEKSKFEIDEIGFMISKVKPGKNTKSLLSVNPKLTTIKSKELIFIKESKWLEIRVYFKAQGGERYLTVGNFDTRKLVSFIDAPGFNCAEIRNMYDNSIPDMMPYAYYYIDNLSFKKVNFIKDFTIQFD